MFIHSNFASKAGALPAPDFRLLDAGPATTVRAQQGGCLVVLEGRAWVTLSRRRGNEEVVDHVLVAGQSLRVPAGAMLVLEDWPPSDNPGPLRVGWQPVQEPAPCSLALRLWCSLRPMVRALKADGLVPRDPAERFAVCDARPAAPGATPG